MTAATLLADLANQGMMIAVDRGDLILDGPPDVLTDSAVAVIRKNKSAILAFLVVEVVRVETAGVEDVRDWTDDDLWTDTTTTCPDCGTAACWIDGLDRWRCMRCDPPLVAERLLAERERILALLPGAMHGS